jgi:uncharacterized protein (DUF1501 family)
MSSTNNMYSPTRRTFIRQAACAALGASGLVGTILDLRKLNAATYSVAGDYKALVCVFLYGGNDGNNVIIPHDAAGYAAYASARSVLAIPQSSLLPLILPDGDGRDFGLHPKLPELQSLFNQGKLGIVANVGTLVAPVTKTEYLSGTAAVPPELFSHSDQSVQWQTSAPNEVRVGWGGRIADLLSSVNGNTTVSLTISVAGTNVFEVGNAVIPFQVSPTGGFGLAGFNGTANANVRLQAFKELLAQPHQNLLEKAYADTVTRSIADNEILRAVPLINTTFPNTDLGRQLKMVARFIGGRTNLGMQRQIFFCAVSGYDTHGPQLTAQSGLLTELSQALSAFYSATVELGVDQQVTTFTASDFGRTFRSNGFGSDHGWGNHQFVLGGAVRGGRLYGTFPTLAIDGPDDTGGQGRWIPTTSVEEFSATMASWFGVADSDLPTVFPNIGRFANPNLGFLS